MVELQLRTFDYTPAPCSGTMYCKAQDGKVKRLPPIGGRIRDTFSYVLSFILSCIRSKVALYAMDEGVTTLIFVSGQRSRWTSVIDKTDDECGCHGAAVKRT